MGCYNCVFLLEIFFVLYMERSNVFRAKTHSNAWQKNYGMAQIPS